MRKDAKIDKPSDLKGKRVGVPEYQQTAALWIRGAMQHEFGVEPKDMEFWMERPPSKSHGGATGFKAPPGVTVNQVPPDKSLGSMMLSGELDAVMFYLVDPNLIDRSTVGPAQPSRHQAAVCRCGRRRRALLPQDRALSDQPRHGDEARTGRAASVGADQHSEGVQASGGAEPTAGASSMRSIISRPGVLPADAQKAFAAPLITHGVQANRTVLETIAQYSLEQGLTPKLTKLEDLYPPSMMSQ